MDLQLLGYYILSLLFAHVFRLSFSLSFLSFADFLSACEPGTDITVYCVSLAEDSALANQQGLSSTS
jgi:hypothetical protein